jgi:hypothetical protein
MKILIKENVKLERVSTLILYIYNFLSINPCHPSMPVHVYSMYCRYCTYCRALCTISVRQCKIDDNVEYANNENNGDNGEFVNNYKNDENR